MKKKFGLWLNIVTICLCVCAIAIGVYAATSATLTVSGQISFEAHGVEFTATAQAKGYVTNVEDATTYVENFKEQTVSGSTVTLEKMYFTDLVGTEIKPIEIEITITNGSLFPVEATLALPTTTVLQENITFDVENGVAQMGDKNDADTKTQTIKITMTLKNAETTALETVQNLNFTITLNKYTQIKGDSTNGYYMTMGSNVVTDENGVQQVEPVKWIPFAESSDGETWAPFVNTNKPDTTKEHYWISEKVLDLQPWTGTSYTFDSGVPFNPYVDYNTGYDTRTGLTSTNANEYLASNIRDLLQGEDAYKTAVDEDGDSICEPGEQKVNLFTEYGITGYVYDQIDTRTAEDLYGSETIPTAISSYNTDNDKLWLLSGDELQYLLNDMNFDYTEYPQSDDLITATFRGGVNSYWWLRSPSADNGHDAWSVDLNGFVLYNGVSYAYGVRPAFKI